MGSIPCARCGGCFPDSVIGAGETGSTREGKPPAIETAGHELVSAEGEPETLAVLNDKRLAGFDIELVGHYEAPSRFMVGPFYTSTSIIVHKDGKRYSVTYWCPVCSIRAYTPGKCVCCQQETQIDLQELKPAN